MLNELEAIRRGLANVGIASDTVHPDVQPVSKAKEPLLVRLNSNGILEGIELLSKAAIGHLWTFREGKHNSFPLVSPPPLLNVARCERDAFNRSWKAANTPDRRKLLSEAKSKYQGSGQWCDGWPSNGLLESLRRKRVALDSIEAEASAVPAVIDRFLASFHVDEDGSSKCRDFVLSLKNAIYREAESGIEDWLEIARIVLIGEYKKVDGKEKLVGGDLYFDVAPGKFNRDVHDPQNRAATATALSQFGKTEVGLCAITGNSAELHRGNFPQTNLPALGLGYVFSKNEDLPAAGSYHRFGHDAFPVGRLVVGELAGAITELVGEPRKNIAWCTVPGERRGTTDLLIAFVEGAPDAPATELLAGDDDDENGELDPVAVYERRTERLIEAVKGRAEEDFRCTPVQVCLLRKVDEGNRKALLHRHLTVGKLYEFAETWAEAQRNLPDWLFLLHRKQRRRPQNLAPLSIPALTKRQFVGGGTQATDAIGIPATEAFGFFLREGDTLRLARRFLHVVLKRDQQLLDAAGHMKHGGRVSRLDTGAALRILTLLAILLHALGRRGGAWMNEAAFRLGQLLSIADVVHAGYCADVRQGQVPPALLGNAVLAMAQGNPSKAIAVLGRRWPPYDSWAKRASAAEARRLRDSKNQDERDRGWKISQAIWQHRRRAEISAALHGQLPQKADDVFRAELLLGYMAGLPPRASAETDGDDHGGEDDAEGNI